MEQVNDKIRQVSGQAVIWINAATDSSQIMAKLCRNNKEWLSPTGWSKSEKSTLLDSEIFDGGTQITIPEAFANTLLENDTISVKIQSLFRKNTKPWI